MTVVADCRRTGIPAKFVRSRLLRGVRLQPDINIVRDEQIQVAVTIEIKECAAGAPHGRIRAAGTWHLRKPAAPRVPIERVRTDVGDVKVDQAVVVVIAGAGAHAVIAVKKSRPGGDILECAVAAIPEQSMARPAADRRIGNRAAVDEKDVDPVVVVEIEEQATGPQNLGEVLPFAGATDMSEAETCRRRDVLERWKRQPCGL